MTAAAAVRNDARDDPPPPGWLLCPACGAPTPKVGRQRYCSAACRTKGPPRPAAHPTTATAPAGHQRLRMR